MRWVPAVTERLVVPSPRSTRGIVSLVMDRPHAEDVFEIGESAFDF
jgi:hypothetical protein